MSDWTFFSNHGHVLVCLARNREVRLRDVAADVGITERAVQKIVRDLQDAGFLTVTKQGRRNRYRINKRRSLRHSLESHCTVGKLLALISKPNKAVMGTELIADAPIEETRSVQPPPADPAPRKKTATRKKKKSPGPVDVRQQGNLF